MPRPRGDLERPRGRRSGGPSGPVTAPRTAAHIPSAAQRSLRPCPAQTGVGSTRSYENPRSPAGLPSGGVALQRYFVAEAFEPADVAALQDVLVPLEEVVAAEFL